MNSTQGYFVPLQVYLGACQFDVLIQLLLDLIVMLETLLTAILLEI